MLHVLPIRPTIGFYGRFVMRAMADKNFPSHHLEREDDSFQGSRIYDCGIKFWLKLSGTHISGKENGNDSVFCTDMEPNKGKKFTLRIFIYLNGVQNTIFTRFN